MREEKPPMRVADVARLMARASESDLTEPLAVLTKQLTDAMDEKVRGRIPHGEHLPLRLVRGLGRELYDYSISTEETATGCNLRCTATPKKDRRLVVDPDKVVVMTDEDGTPVGYAIADGAFTIVERA